MNARTPYYPDSFYSFSRLFITLFIAIVGNAGMWAIVVIMPNLGDEFRESVLSIPYTLTMLGFALGNVFRAYRRSLWYNSGDSTSVTIKCIWLYLCLNFDSFIALTFFVFFWARYSGKLALYWAFLFGLRNIVV